MLSRRAVRVALAVMLCVVPSLVAVSPASAGEDQGSPDYYNSGLAPTPYMGWNTYYGVGAPSESTMVSVADFLVSSGLRDAGYRYVWIDGGWNAPTPRDSAGNLVADPARFPHGLAWLTSYLHGEGLRAGIYTDAGPSNGSCAAASGGHYDADTKQFASWGFDAVKVDFLCGIAAGVKPAQAYPQFSAALQKAGRPMLLNVCNPVTSGWGNYPADELASYSYTFGPTSADSWRTSTDVAFGTPTAGEWSNVLRNMDDNLLHPEAQGPGHYNDPDYLVPMRRLAGGGLEMSQEESTSQLVMWAEMASPLIIGSDPRTLPSSMISTLTNPEIIAVDQDPLASEGVRVDFAGNTEVYSKVLSGTGQRAVVLLNRGSTASQVTVRFNTTGLGGQVSVRDLRARADLGSFTDSYTATVPAHGTAFLRLQGTDLMPGNDLGGAASASPGLVRFDDTHAMAFTRGDNGDLQVQTLAGTTWSRSWTSLGGPTGGQMLGQPAVYGSAGGRVDVFVRGTDNGAYQRTFDGSSWGAWVSLGGLLTDSPSVAYTGPDSWKLFVRGVDGQIYWRTATSGWASIGGGGIYGRPGVATDDSGTTYVAVRINDDSVWLRTQDAAGNWSNWGSLGGLASGSPTLLATLGRVYLFVRASDYTLWQMNHVNGAWTGWFKRYEFPSGSFTGSLGAAPGANGYAWVAARGADNHIHQTIL